MGERADEHDGERHADRDQQPDGKDAALQLREIQSERGLENETRYERHKQDVAADVRERRPGQETHEHAGESQHNRVRHEPRPFGNETEERGDSPDEDEQQEESLLGGHGVLTPRSTCRRARP